MEMETLTVDEAGSTLAEQGLLILSVTSIDDRRPRTVELVVGRVGFPSLSRTLKAGGAVLFETPDYGVFEIRLLRIYIGYQTPGSLPNTATFSISPLTRRPGPMAGLENENSDNHPFTASEVARIRESIEGVKDSVGQRDDVTPEQVD